MPDPQRTPAVVPDSEPAGWQVRCGRFFFRHRQWVMPPAILLLCAVFKPGVPFGGAARDVWADLAGLLVAVSGQALRAAVIGYAYIRRGGKDGSVYADDLVTGGFFRHCRNPLYVGNILIYAGLLVLYNNIYVDAIGLAFVIFVYTSIVAAEESYLNTRFGRRYETYCREVNRWMPNFRGLSQTVQGMRFNWRRLIRKEYGSFSAWMLAAVLILGIKTINGQAPASTRTMLELLAAAFLCIACFWTVARILKKRRLLRDPLAA